MSNYLLSGFLTGFIEISIFHPFDTAIKRLINYDKILINSSDKSKNYKINSFYNGYSIAALYKISQRTLMFGYQPIIYNRLNKENNKYYNCLVSGSMIGITEVLLLPLNRLKVICQTNEKIKIKDVINRNKFKLYKGLEIVALRNSIGCTTLFSSKLYMESNNVNTLLSSYLSASLCILFSSPFDTIKIKIQSKLDSDVNSFNIIKNIYRNKGINGYFIGLYPKLILVSPKLGFGLYISKLINDYLNN